MLTLSSPTPTQATSSWNVQSVDEKAVLYSAGVSIAVDSSGNPHFCYTQSMNGSFLSPNSLVYTSWNGSGWDAQTVTPNSLINYNGLVIDTNDTPHIVFDSWNEEGEISLKYATWTGTNWSIQTIDTGNLRWDSYASIALDAADHPHVAYSGPHGELKYAWWTGEYWNMQTIALAKSGFQYLALDSAGQPHIVYGYNPEDSAYSNLTVCYAYWNNKDSDWYLQTVVSNVNCSTFGNLVLDSADYPHFTSNVRPTISTGNTSIMYNSWNGSAWASQYVGPARGAGNDGAFLRLDSQGNPHIAYQKYTNTMDGLVYSLMYASRDDYEVWHLETAYSTKAMIMGTPTPFVLDQMNNPHICFLKLRPTQGYYFDGTVMYAAGQPEQYSNPLLTAPVIVSAALLVSIVVVGTAYLLKKRKAKEPLS